MKRRTIVSSLAVILALAILLQSNANIITGYSKNYIPSTIYASESSDVLVDENIIEDIDENSTENAGDIGIVTDTMPDSAAIPELILDPTPEPTVEPTPEPTATLEPTLSPTLEPTSEPTAIPTEAPTEVPTMEPTLEPTLAPTMEPTAIPTLEPTSKPTITPTEEPVAIASPLPSVTPTAVPSPSASASPTSTIDVSASPSVTPSASPSVSPSPSATPTSTPKALPEQSDLKEAAVSRENSISAAVGIYNSSLGGYSGLGNHPDFIPFTPEFESYVTTDLSEVEEYLNLVDLDKCQGTVTVTDVESTTLSNVPEIKVLDSLTTEEFENSEDIYFEHKELQAEADGYEIIVSGDVPSNAELNVEVLNTNNYVDAIAEMYGVSNNAVKLESVMDIAVVCDGVQYQPEEFGSSLEVTIKNMESSSTQQIVHIHDDNYAEQISIVDENSTETTFNTDSFSVYTIGEIEYDTTTATVYSVGQNLSGYLFADGVFIVTGTGDDLTATFGPYSTMADCPWESITHFYIKTDTITTTNVSLFQGNSVIKYVELNEGLTKVQSWAFREAANLETVILPSTVTKIEDNAFTDCISLNNISLPNGVSTINSSAFLNCASLVSISLPDTLTELSYALFSGCDNLTTIVLGNNVTTISERCFIGCTTLSSINLPSTLTSIGISSFESTSSLISLEIPSGITNIPDCCFYKSGIQSVTFKGNIETIGKYAFCDCTLLTELNIPNTVLAIGEQAFNNCKEYASTFDFLSNVIDFSYRVFYGCNKLIGTNINYSKINSIDNEAFAFCYNLQDELVFTGAPITVIGENAFYECKSVKNLVLNDSLITIKPRAFYFTSSITNSVTIPAGVTVLSDSCFKLSGITGIICLGNIKAIETYALSECSNLVSVSIPDTVTTLGSYAFFRLKNLETPINFISNVTEIPTSVFLECEKIPSVVFSDNLTSIGYASFKNCYALDNIDLSKTKLISIPSETFFHCHSAKEIKFPDTLESIGQDAFTTAKAITKLDLSNTKISSVGAYCFNYAENLTEVILPETLTILSNHMFDNDTNLSKINLGHVTSFGWYTFNKCLSLKNIDLTSAETIDSTAFGGNDVKIYTTLIYTDENADLVEEYDWTGQNRVLISGVKLNTAGDLFGNFDPDTGILTVSGEGENLDISLSSALGELYSSLVGLKFESENIKTIGNEWASNLSLTQNVSLPDGITSIGNRAFYNSLQNVFVNIPSKIETIGSEAFYGMNKVTDINFGPNLTSIGTNAFMYTGSNPATLDTNVVSESTVAASYNWAGDNRNVTIEQPFTYANNSSLFKLYPNSTDTYYYIDEEGTLWFYGNNSSLNSRPNNTNNNILNEVDGVDLVSIKNIRFTSDCGTINITNTTSMFACMSNCISIDLSKFDTSNATSMTSMFKSCSSLETLDLSILDTSNVTNMSYMFSDCMSLKTLDLSNFNTSNVKYMQSMFNNCKVLTELDLSNFNTSNVTDMRYMFWSCKLLKELDVSSFNTSNVKDLSRMFGYCSSLTELDLSHFDTRNVTDMTYMFTDCSALELLDVSSFNTDKVTNMFGMFSGCKSVAELNVSGFNTSNVTSMAYMFNNCRELTELDVSGFNTSKVTAMQEMFTNCKNVQKLDISNFDTTNVTSFYNMFGLCSSIKELDMSNWNTSNVTSMKQMFNDCTLLKEIDISNFDMNNVESVFAMFDEDCVQKIKMPYIDVTDRQGMFLNPRHWVLENDLTTDMYSVMVSTTEILPAGTYLRAYKTTVNCYYEDTDTSEEKVIYVPCDTPYSDAGLVLPYYTNCEAYTNADYSNTFDLNTLATMDRTIYMKYSEYCFSYVGNEDLFKLYPNSTDTYYYIDDEGILWFYGDNSSLNSYATNCILDSSNILTIIDDVDVSKITSVKFTNDCNTINITDGSYMFYKFANCITIDLDKFNISGKMSNMFYNCKLLQSLDFSKLGTVSVTSLSQTFYYCESLISLDLSNFDTTNNRYLEGTFYNCKSLTTLDISNFDTSNVTIMSTMFYGCSLLSKLDLSNFNTSNVTNMSNMFYNCKSLTELDLSNFNTSNVTNMNSMFCNCSKLSLLNISNFNTDKVTNMISMFNGCSGLTLLDVTGFNTVNVINMESMFNGCKNLEKIDVTGFNTVNVTNMSYMFYGCNNLEKIDISNFSTDNVTNMSYMFLMPFSSALLEEIKLPEISCVTRTNFVKEAPWIYEDNRDTNVYSLLGGTETLSAGTYYKAHEVTVNCDYGSVDTTDIKYVYVPLNKTLAMDDVYNEDYGYPTLYTDSAMTKEYDISSLITANTTLYAKYIYILWLDTAKSLLGELDEKTGVLTITGTGTDLDIKLSDVLGEDYLDIKSIVFVTDTVKSICDEWCKNCTSLVGTLEIPDGIVSIGDYAFEGCTGFSGNLIIPDSVTALGVWCFSNCTGIDGYLYLPDTISVINEGTFYGNNKLSKLYIGSGVVLIGENAFTYTGDTPEILNTKLLTESEAVKAYGWVSNNRSISSMNTFIIALPQEISMKPKYMNTNDEPVWYSAFNMEITGDFENGSYGSFEGVPSFTISSSSGESREVSTNVEDTKVTENGTFVIPIVFTAPDPDLSEEYTGTFSLNSILHQIFPSLTSD